MVVISSREMWVNFAAFDISLFVYIPSPKTKMDAASKTIKSVYPITQDQGGCNIVDGKLDISTPKTRMDAAS